MNNKTAPTRPVAPAPAVVTPPAPTIVYRDRPVETVGTNCCALVQITANDCYTAASIKAKMNQARRSGYMAAFVITKVSEPNLVKRLKLLKFRKITTFYRRTNYDTSMLSMWFIRLSERGTQKKKT